MSSYEYEQTIEQIAAGLAHEVKNPLSLVKANIDLLELYDTQNSHKNNYTIMRREIDRINDLLLDFIQLTKPAENDMKTFSLNKMLCTLIDSLKSTYYEQIEFILNFEGHEFNVFADENKIYRVLLNVLKNSIEAISSKNENIKSENNTININLSMSENNKYVTILILDNGIGFKKQEINKVMEPFYTTKSGGSGLGLHLCKNIIEEHKGYFEIASEKGKGCLVTITLPREGY